MRFLIYAFVQKYIFKSRLISLLKKYRKTQYFSEKDIVDFQQEKLHKILKYAVDKVPFYKYLSEQFYDNENGQTIYDKLSLFPIIDKNTIRNNFDLFKAEGVNPKKVRSNATSGSTGQNFVFLSHNNSHGQALQIRQNEWIGQKMFDKEIKIWGAAFDVKKTKKMIPRIKNSFKRTIVLSGYNLSDDKMKEYVLLIKKEKPKVLHSYSSILYLLAVYIEKNKLVLYPLIIKSAGEKLFPFQREKIETVFKSKVFDFYGARDIPMVAQECEKHNGLHLMMENVYAEILNSENQPLEEGEGDLVLTHFHNFAMPFIRYRIGDRALISNRKCTCGRNLKLIDEIVGRSFDIVQFPNGNRVGGTFWTFVMKSVKGINDFQVVQISNCKIEINCTLFDNEEKVDFKRLEDTIKTYSGNDLELVFVVVDSINPTSAGKRMFVISKK